MNVSNLCPAVESMSWSILGRGKLSFEHALFRSMKSTHTLHFPFAFFTRTTFANRSRYCTSRMNPTASSLVTSFVTAWFRSGVKTLHLC